MRRSPLYRLNNFLLKHRLLLYLLTLVALLFLFPFLDEQFTGHLMIMEVCFSLILIAGIYAVSSNKQLLTVAVLLAVLIFTIIWFNIFLRSEGLLIFSLSLEVIFFLITTTTILSHVLGYERVTADKIYGSICGYLLIGIIWSLSFTIIELLYPGTFFFAHGIQASYEAPFDHPFYFSHFIYYSFITLTTTGYGDITPLSNTARTLSALEAAIGQLYLAVLIARLVGLHITHTFLMDRKSSEKNQKN